MCDACVWQFVRTVASFNSLAPAVSLTMQRLGWKRCFVLSSTQNLYLMTSGVWSQHLASQNITVSLKTFGAGAFESAMLEEMQQANMRVVIVLADKPDTAKLALSAHQLGMTSASWAWLGVDNVAGAELLATATMTDRARRALHGWLFFMPKQAPPQQSAEFHRQVRAYGQKYFGLSPAQAAVDLYAAELFDAVYLFAHAATRVMEAGGDVSSGAQMMQVMRNISFVGIQQRTVALDANGDAIQPYSVMNYVEENAEMRSVEVGWYESGQLELKVADVRWPGNATTVPKDTAQELVLVLGALLPMDEHRRSRAGALPLAVERVNADPTLLPGCKLEWRWRDSGCSAAAALQGLGSLTSEGPIAAVIGPSCSTPLGCAQGALLWASLASCVHKTS